MDDSDCESCDKDDDQQRAADDGPDAEPVAGDWAVRAGSETPGPPPDEPEGSDGLAELEPGDPADAERAASVEFPPADDAAEERSIDPATLASVHLGVPKVLFGAPSHGSDYPTDFVEPPSGPGIADVHAIRGLAAPPGEPEAIEVGSYDSAAAGSSVEQLGQNVDASASGGREAAANLSPRTPDVLGPTSDGGPPLARPIVIVTLPGEQLRRLEEDALTSSAARSVRTCREIAEQRVNHALWVRDCEDRAINGDW
jgi:hypothetical protein